MCGLYSLSLGKKTFGSCWKVGHSNLIYTLWDSMFAGWLHLPLHACVLGPVWYVSIHTMKIRNYKLTSDFC